MKYRVTFTKSGRCGAMEKPKPYKYDVEADSFESALHLAYQAVRPKEYGYDNATTELIPDGPSVIGICFVSRDTVLGRDFSDYLFILADDEKSAAEYYRRNIQGKRYWFNASRPEADGKCIYGAIKETYFAAVDFYGFNAV